jgi:hypothetical protein
MQHLANPGSYKSDTLGRECREGCVHLSMGRNIQDVRQDIDRSSDESLCLSQRPAANNEAQLDANMMKEYHWFSCMCG